MVKGQKILIIGLTGGIGSGKTTIAKLFSELGVPIVDADAIARQVVEPGSPALTEIAQTFGPDIIEKDGTLNRRAMRQLIFNDAKKRHQLEKILHPRIQREMLAQTETLKGSYCIFAIPLLFEAKQQHLVDRTLLVDCNEQTRRQRLRSRDNMSDSDVDKAFAAQFDQQQRLSLADDVITNNQDIDSLRSQVIALHQRYKRMAR